MTHSCSVVPSGFRGRCPDLAGKARRAHQPLAAGDHTAPRPTTSPERYTTSRSPAATPRRLERRRHHTRPRCRPGSGTSIWQGLGETVGERCFLPTPPQVGREYHCTVSTANDTDHRHRLPRTTSVAGGSSRTILAGESSRDRQRSGRARCACAAVRVGVWPRCVAAEPERRDGDGVDQHLHREHDVSGRRSHDRRRAPGRAVGDRLGLVDVAGRGQLRDQGAHGAPAEPRRCAEFGPRRWAGEVDVPQDRRQVRSPHRLAARPDCSGRGLGSGCVHGRRVSRARAGRLEMFVVDCDKRGAAVK